MFTDERIGYHHQFQRPKSPPEETPEEYAARLRKSREEQVAAEERRAREDAERKVRVEEERKKGKRRSLSLVLSYGDGRYTICAERQEAEKRQKAKKANKKGQAEASRKKAEDAIRTQQERAQTLRSSVFAAARTGNAEKVKKGVWEDSVDAAGGEVKKGCEVLVATPPNDPKETLMHIAVKHGDADLVEWLEAHSGYRLLSIVRTVTDTIPRCRTRRTQLARTHCFPSCCSTGPQCHHPETLLRELPSKGGRTLCYILPAFINLNTDSCSRVGRSRDRVAGP